MLPMTWISTCMPRLQRRTVTRRQSAICSVRFQLSGIFIDGANDRLYVADQAGNAVAVYDHASTLNGPITANRAVQGAATHLSGPGERSGGWSGTSWW